MRGEHWPESLPEMLPVGSSPHARGTHHRTSGIPLNQTVHPRMRGEHCLPCVRSVRCGGSSPHARGHGGPGHENWKPDGSSPHARGTQRRPRQRVPGPRFIPACAGNTPEPSPRALLSPVHPRMRGEHDGPYIRTEDGRGSSPHARGTHLGVGDAAKTGRFIPACAGNTCRPSHGTDADTVHPRMRGEHAATRAANSANSGSSPHARGTRASRRGPGGR